MEILGIGFYELVFILLVAIIIMGPKDMQKAGKTVGKWLRNIVTSDGWKMFQQTSRELRALPTRLMREANEELEQVNKIGREINNPRGNFDMKYRAPAHSQPAPLPPLGGKAAAMKENENESDLNDDA